MQTRAEAERNMKLNIVVKHQPFYPWTACVAFAERRIAENFIECERAIDPDPRWEFAIVSGELEEVKLADSGEATEA